MKKLLLIPLILIFLNTTFYTEQEKEVHQLSLDICNKIIIHQRSLHKQGYKTKDLWWSSYNYTMPGSSTTYPTKMKAGEDYIFYTKASNNAKIRVCVTCDNNPGLNEYTTSCSNSIIFYYHAYKTGSYHYIVKGCRDTGIHVSYMTKVISKKI